MKAELFSEGANHDLLKRLSAKTGGEFVGAISTDYESEVGDSYVQTIVSKINKKDILHEFTERLELINLKFILWLLIGGLTLEWVVRCRQGGY